MNLSNLPSVQGFAGILYGEQKNGVPKGNRTPVAGMKTRCPGPLDDGDLLFYGLIITFRNRSTDDNTLV